MTFSLHQLDVFEFEVRRTADFYAVEAPDLLDNFFTELDATMARIARFPTVPRIVRGATRAVHLGARFPYSVLYVVHESLEIVDLTILLHDRQDRHGLLPRLA